MEPDWFKEEILAKVFVAGGLEIEWQGIVARVRNVLYDPDDKYDEPTFGVDAGEFWSTVGGVTGRILRDHGRAIRLLRVAEQHAEVTGGKFRAYVGLALQYREIGDLPSYNDYLQKMCSVARAYQYDMINEFKATPAKAGV